MNNKYLTQSFILILLILFVIALPAQGQEDIYFIFNGPGFGNFIFTEKDSTIVAPELNQDIEAEGKISNAEPIIEEEIGELPKGCDGKHYHGLLFGEGDPFPRTCGWGEVEKVANSKRKSILSSLLSIFNNEKGIAEVFESAESEFTGNKGDLSKNISTANNFLKDLERIDIDIAMEEIESLIKTVKESAENNEIEKDTANSIIKNLKCAFRADKEVKRKIESLKKSIGSINSAKSSEEGISKLINATNRTDQRIRGALDCKLNVIDAILKAESKEE